MISQARKNAAAIFGVSILLITALWHFGPRSPAPWTAADLAVLQSLSIDSLPALPPDVSNAVADREAAAKFGQKLFFDTRMSATGNISCATCHQPERRFTDGLPKGRGIGLSARNTRSIVASAYSPWLYWDGRKDSLWSQALAPLEDPREHGSTRVQIVRLVSADKEYRELYTALFGSLADFSDRDRFPDAAAPGIDTQSNVAWQSTAAEDRHIVNTAFANVGKAIAAYERRLLPGPGRFDSYVRALLAGENDLASSILSNDEILGLQLFIDEARCTECHNGPLLTNNEFHNTAILSFPGDLPDRGRIDGLKRVREDPFNCLGAYSDDLTSDCPELTYVRTGIELIGATRTPSLRNVGGTAPYAHKGQLATLADVLDQYNRAPLAMIGHNEAKELKLSRRELKWLAAFLDTLDAPLATPPEWLESPR